MDFLTEEIAIAEFEKWINAKKVSVKARRMNEHAESVIIGALMDGSLIVEDDLTLTHKLCFPITSPQTGEVTFDRLNYKLRMSVDERNQAVKGYAPDDGEGRIIGFAAHLTSSPRGIITKLDTVDYQITQSICLYFL